MRVLVAGLATWCALGPALGAHASLAWGRWVAVPGVFDLGGPTRQGMLVAAGAGALYLVSPAGDLIPYASGAGGYHQDAGAEAYLATSSGLRDVGNGCSFETDDVYVLRLHAPVGITRVSASGDAVGNFATIPGAGSLNGIAFDTGGAFGHRLLVSSSSGGKIAVFAIDCNGAVSVITKSAPQFEGGLSIAPASFGRFGGTLIGADELSGAIWSIDASGAARKVVDSGLPSGPDTGVESLAFVPGGFAAGGFLYAADRDTPGSAHPGTGSVLRLASGDLVAAGVAEGDLLAATEGGDRLLDVRCGATCSLKTLIETDSVAHGEGHLAIALAPSSESSPLPQEPPLPPQAHSVDPRLLFALLALAVATGGAIIALSGRRRRE